MSLDFDPEDFAVTSLGTPYDFHVAFPDIYEGSLHLSFSHEVNPVSVTHLDAAFKAFFDKLAENYNFEVSVRPQVRTANTQGPYYSTDNPGGDEGPCDEEPGGEEPGGEDPSGEPSDGPGDGSGTP